MRRRGFLSCAGLMLGALSLSLSAVALANPATVNIAELQTIVKNHVAQHYTARLGAEQVQNQIAIDVGTLDPRLRLGQCDQPLTLSVREPPQGHGNLTVKTSCEGNQRWTIYVPVRVDIYAEVAVASRSLARGHLIQEADIGYQRNNLSQLGLGHVKDGARLLGKELQRPMRAGDAFRLANLGQPEVVQRGDSVIVEAQAGSLVVVAPGKALASGAVGTQIRVENTQSKRIIDAEVVAAGRVKVLL